MSIVTEYGDKISPSLFDVRILIALAGKSLTAYSIARQLEHDMPEAGRTSNGSLRPALARIEQATLVSRSVEGLYQLTDFGHIILTTNLDRLDTLIGYGRSRI